MTTTCYLAGPMRGLPFFGFPAFDSAAEYLRSTQWDVRSPAEHDRENGFDETRSESFDNFDVEAAIVWDLDQVRQADAIVILPGWRQSKGVAAEKALAEFLGKQILYYDPEGRFGHRLRDDPLSEDCVEATPIVVRSFPGRGEVRVTDPTTGGQKGQKLAQVGALAPESLLAVAEVAGFGASKYERFNFLRGYAWSLSFDAACRHALQWYGGEDRDPESGLSHLAHWAWHALTLLAFTARDLGTDDRPKEIARG